LVARQDGVISGVPLALAAFRALDSHVEIRIDAADGTAVTRGQTVLHISGSTRAILSAERVALNFAQRLSGVATLTARYVAAVQGLPVQIVDTRKTTPGWRLLEKYAVRCGGGSNHRATLADAVLIKDNHIAACRGDVALSVQRAREHAAAGLLIQVECDTVAQARVAIAAGANHSISQPNYVAAAIARFQYRVSRHANQRHLETLTLNYCMVGNHTCHSRNASSYCHRSTAFRLNPPKLDTRVSRGISRG
jgi:nicotinate-nucleotide pyrophosphorylase (carboxylating)